MVKKLVSDPVIKCHNWTFFWTDSLKWYKVCVYCLCLSRGLRKFINPKVLTTCFHLIYSFFKKIKRDQELVSLPHFLHNIWRKMFLMLYFINWQNFIYWLPFLLEILGNLSVIIIFCPACDVINIEINHSFLVKSFFYITKMSKQRYKYLKNQKSF